MADPMIEADASLCPMSASGGKRYWVRSLSYWSHKTLESNKSVLPMRPVGAGVLYSTKITGRRPSWRNSSPDPRIA